PSFFFSSRRRHTRFSRDWSSDVCSSDLIKKRNVNGLLLHSDQGFQYTSRQYNNLLKRYNIKASMSRKGNCLDNACMENFFSHFRSEERRVGKECRYRW